MVRGSNSGGDEIFFVRSNRPWDPRSLLYNGYRPSFPGIKQPGRGVDHPPSSSAVVKERVELYLYAFMAGSMVNFTLVGTQWCRTQKSLPLLGFESVLSSRCAVTLLTHPLINL